MRDWVTHILLGATSLWWAAAACGAEADGKNDRPATHMNSAGDYFAAGGNLELSGDVNGDALLAGGNVVLQRQVKGDATVAGGNVTVRSKVRGNLRAAGGTVTIEAYTVSIETAFKKADADADAALTPDEWAGAPPKSGK